MQFNKMKPFPASPITIGRDFSTIMTNKNGSDLGVIHVDLGGGGSLKPFIYAVFKGVIQVI